MRLPYGVDDPTMAARGQYDESLALEEEIRCDLVLEIVGDECAGILGRQDLVRLVREPAIEVVGRQPPEAELLVRLSRLPGTSRLGTTLELYEGAQVSLALELVRSDEAAALMHRVRQLVEEMRTREEGRGAPPKGRSR